MKITCIENLVNSIIDKSGVKRAELLDGIYYCNGVNGTRWDWQVNNHLSPFIVFYKSKDWGFCKIFLMKSGRVDAYYYLPGALLKPIKFETEPIPPEDVEALYEELIKKSGYDKEVSDL